MQSTRRTGKMQDSLPNDAEFDSRRRFDLNEMREKANARCRPEAKLQSNFTVIRKGRTEQEAMEMQMKDKCSYKHKGTARRRLSTNKKQISAGSKEKVTRECLNKFAHKPMNKRDEEIEKLKMNWRNSAARTHLCKLCGCSKIPQEYRHLTPIHQRSF